MGKVRTPKQKLEARALLRVLLDIGEEGENNSDEFFTKGVLVSRAYIDHRVDVNENNVNELLEHYAGRYVQSIVVRGLGDRLAYRGYRILLDRKEDILSEIRGR